MHILTIPLHFSTQVCYFLGGKGKQGPGRRLLTNPLIIELFWIELLSIKFHSMHLYKIEISVTFTAPRVMHLQISISVPDYVVVAGIVSDY